MLSYKIWRYQKGVARSHTSKDRQYNGKKKNAQKDKEWSSKHLRKNYSPRIQITNRILQKNYWNWR